MKSDDKHRRGKNQREAFKKWGGIILLDTKNRIFVISLPNPFLNVIADSESPNSLGD